MSSGTKYQPDAFRRMQGVLSSKTMAQQVGRMGMTPRQQELDKRWKVYNAAQYDNRKTDWDGSTRPDAVEHEAIASAGFIPPGFYDAGGQMNELPIKFRRPAIPYHLGKVIVDRFTGMLFSERRHPRIRVAGDAITEDWIEALTQTSRLWQKMINARKYGGATGTVCVGFTFLDGQPIIEPHDPRYIIPDFQDRISLKLRGFEKRFMYPQEIEDPDTGKREEVWFWYRRVVDRVSDVVYMPALVQENGDEPEWIEDIRVDHKLGFCPAVWVQNLPVDDDIDGEADCHGVWDMLEGLDTLMSMSYKSTILNADPTLIITSTDELDSVMRKGSGNAVKLTNGDAKYLELMGSGPKTARELAKEVRVAILEVAQCVLDADAPSDATKTATEILRRYSSMISKADILREQYGQKCVIPLIEMMIRAAAKMAEKVPQDGQIVSYKLNMPPRVDENGYQVDRQLGPGGMLYLQWPGYFELSVDDAIKATTAAANAKLAGLADEETAIKYVADYFNIENVGQTMLKIKAEEADQQVAMESELMAKQSQRAEELPKQKKSFVPQFKSK